VDWFAVVDDATGRLVSIGTVIASPLSAGLVAIRLGKDQPNLGDVMWDAASRSFVARPPIVLIDRLDDLKSDADFSAALASLNPAGKNRMLDLIGDMLGPVRFRVEGEDVNL